MSKLWAIMGFYTNVEPHVTLPVLILGPEFDEEKAHKELRRLYTNPTEAELLMMRDVGMLFLEEIEIGEEYNYDT